MTLLEQHSPGRNLLQICDLFVDGQGHFEETDE